MERPRFGISLCTLQCILLGILLGIMLGLLTSGARAAQGQDSRQGDGAADGQQSVEAHIIRQSMASRHWLVRAVAAMQIESAAFAEAESLLLELFQDRDWRVRAFAIRSIGRRQNGASLLEQPINDRDPRVMRAAMLYQLPVDPAMLQRHITSQLRSRVVEERLIGIELAAMADDPDIRSRALREFGSMLERLDELQILYISRRLGQACGLRSDAKRAAWGAWYQQCLADDALHMKLTPTTPPPHWKQPAAPPVDADEQTESDDDDGDGDSGREDREDDDDKQPPSPRHRISDLTPEQYVRFRDDYLTELKALPIDLVICIDRSGSMGATLDGVKAGADQMIRFLSDASLRLRVGVVTYAGDPSELTGQQLTDRPNTIKDFIWQIQIGRGAVETVYLALEAAIMRNRYTKDAVRSVVLIGDEPFQSLNAQKLRELVHYAAEEGIVVSTVKAASPLQARVREGQRFLPEWDQIAEWSGGRCVTLERASDITAMIIGLTIGGNWVDEIDDLIGAYNECIP